MAVAGPVPAAEISSIPLSDNAGLISIVGELQLGDEKRFASEIIRYSDGAALLASGGGNLHAGLEIGRAIRIKGFSTYVPSGASCASSCALAWLGGRKHLISQTGRVGFHAASLKANDGTILPTAIGNALIGAYLNQLGLPTSSVIYITSAPPSEILWLDEASKSAGINFDYFDLEATKTKSAASKDLNLQSDSNNIRIVNFLKNYLINYSNTISFDPNFVRNVYAPSLQFYKTRADHQFIIQEQFQHIERWPDRQYRILPGSLQSNCTESARRCEVTVILEWVVRSPARNSQSVGRAQWQLTLQIDGPRIQIVEEDGQTLDRKISKLRQ